MPNQIWIGYEVVLNQHRDNIELTGCRTLFGH